MRCSMCRTENQPQARYCAGCGSHLDAPPSDRQAGPPTGTLVPRELGDLVGETFRIYRGSFWDFVLIAFWAQVPFILGELIPILALSIILSVLGILTYILAEGATIHGVAQQYLGREVKAGDCYKRAWKNFGTLLVGWIVFFLVLAIFFLTIIGIPLFFYFLVTRFFYAQAIMIERRRSLEALSRSRDLVRGTWWRVFAIGVVFIAIIFTLAICVSIPGALASPSSATVGAILLTIGAIIITPIGYIGAAVVYLDLRTRKEGYTLDTMALEVGD